MENNKMLVLGGGAVACFALGYLGIQYMDDETELPENIITDESKDIDTVEEKKIDFKKEITKEITNIKETVETGWGQFWKGAYDEETNKKEEANNVEVTDNK